jgi:ABC-type bacteriocin/lantibiotic exporter with double-glycine peptidase domain
MRAPALYAALLCALTGALLGAVRPIVVADLLSGHSSSLIGLSELLPAVSMMPPIVILLILEVIDFSTLSAQGVLLARASSKAGKAWRVDLTGAAIRALSGHADSYLTRYAGLIKPYVDAIELFFRHNLVPSIAASAQLTLALILAFQVNPTVALLLLGKILVLLTLTVCYSKIHIERAASHMKAEEIMLASATLSPRKGLSIWFGGGAAHWHRARLTEIAAAAKARNGIWTAEAIFYATSSAIAGLFIVAGHVVLIEMRQGSMYDFVALFTYCGLMVAPVMRISAFVPEYREYSIACAELRRAISSVQDSEPFSGQVKTWAFFGQRPTTNYPSASFDFKVSSGQRIALIGSSGSGKTTSLLALLGANSDVLQNVLVASIPVEKIRQSLPDLGVRYLSDTPAFETGTVLSNCGGDAIACMDIISNFDLFADRETSEIRTLLNLTIRSSGEPLSLGERQRIQLLRTLLHRPKVLFLDEALSGIEERLEQTIVSKLIEDRSIEIIVYTGHRTSVTQLFPEQIKLASRVIDRADHTCSR